MDKQSTLPKICTAPVYHRCVGHFVSAFETAALLVMFVIHLAYLLVSCSLHPTERWKIVSDRTGGTVFLFWPTQSRSGVA